MLSEGGDDGEGAGDPGVGLLYLGVPLLLPVLESNPPGEVAPPVDAPEDMPKWE